MGRARRPASQATGLTAEGKFFELFGTRRGVDQSQTPVADSDQQLLSQLTSSQRLVLRLSCDSSFDVLAALVPGEETNSYDVVAQAAIPDASPPFTIRPDGHAYHDKARLPPGAVRISSRDFE